MVRFNKMTEYGLSIVGYLVSVPRQMYTSAQLSEALHIAPSAVTKILKILAKGEYLDATRGAHGGYSISQKCLEASVFDIVSCIEGPVVPIDCMHNSEQCVSSKYCKSKGALLPLALHLVDVLKKMPISRLASKSIQITPAKLHFDDGADQKVTFFKGE